MLQPHDRYGVGEGRVRGWPSSVRVAPWRGHRVRLGRRETAGEKNGKMRGREEQTDALWLTLAAKGVGRIDCVDQTEVPVVGRVWRCW